MEREEIEYITALIDITVTNTLTKLDLIPERYSESKANKIYGEKQIKRWREKRWITAYSSGNETNAKLCYLRSECETARLMMESILRKGYEGKITKTMEGNSIRPSFKKPDNIGKIKSLAFNLIHDITHRCNPSLKN